MAARGRLRTLAGCLVLALLSLGPRALAEADRELPPGVDYEPAPSAKREVPPNPERERKMFTMPRALTRRGRVLLGGSLGATWAHDDTSGYGVLKSWSVYANPSATYFVAHHIGLGVNLGGGASRTQYSPAFGSIEYHDRDLLAGLSIMFDVPIGKRVSLVFQTGASYLHQWRRPTDAPALELSYVRVAMSVPFLFHLAPDIAIGFGPDTWVDTNISSALPTGSEESSFFNSGPSGVRVIVGLSASMFFAL
jgi:hypothetical protein